MVPNFVPGKKTKKTEKSYLKLVILCIISTGEIRHTFLVS